jgi:hypothetical protein
MNLGTKAQALADECRNLLDESKRAAFKPGGAPAPDLQLSDEDTARVQGLADRILNMNKQHGQNDE